MRQIPTNAAVHVVAPYQLHPVVAETRYGTVTTERVTFTGRGRVRGRKSKEDLAIRHITTVREEMQRNLVGGLIIGCVGGYALFAGKSTTAMIIGIALIMLGIIIFRGSPTIIIGTSGGEKIQVKGSTRDASELTRFANAIRNEVFSSR